MSSEVLGNVGELHVTTINFNAVHTVTGGSGAGFFDLAECTGLKHLLSARASAKIVSNSLTCQVIGPASAAKAVSAHLGVIPTSCASTPTTAEEVMTIGGSAFVQHSLYVGAQSANLLFSQEVSHQLKPTVVIGSPPRVVFHYTVTGGASTDIVHFRISGVLTVDGIGFVVPWQ
jgi:hypothetical protein